MSLFFQFPTWISREFYSQLFRFLLVAFALTSSSGAFAVSNQIAAVVNDDVITESEVAAKLIIVRADPSNPVNKKLKLATNEAQARNVLLDSMIEELVQRQYAKRVNLKVSNSRIDNELEALARGNKMSTDQFQALIEGSGVDWSNFKREVETRIIVQNLIRRVVAPSISVSDFEIKEFLRQSGIEGQADEYEFSHLLVKLADVNGVKVPADQEDVLVEQLRQLKSNVSSKEQFESEAKALADSSAFVEFNKVSGRKSNQLPALFVQELSRLQAGENSEILRSASALHLLQLNEVTSLIPKGVEKRKLAHILINAQSKEERKVAAIRLTQLRDRTIDGESFSTLATQNSDDSNSAAVGGDLGWVKPGDTVPTFEKAAFSLQELGMVSEPVNTQFGVHIVKLLEVSNQDKDESMQSLARSRVVAHKANQQYPVWLSDLVSGAYVKRYSNSGGL